MHGGENLILCVGNVLAEHAPALLLVLTAHQLAEECIHVFALLLFLLKLTVVVDKHKGNHAHNTHHGDNATEIVQTCNSKTEQECRTRRNKPTSDNSNYACNAINCRFASPSSVCKARTHRNHEGYVSCREGQLKRSTNHNQQPCQHKVYAGTHKVERHAFV